MADTTGTAGGAAGHGEAPAILIVDDSAGTRELLSYLLTHEGYHVLEAVSGTEGIAMAREHRPAAIILDVIMPGMDGWAVLEQLKADVELAGIPVIMATVLDEASRGYVFGATAYLTKPLERRALLALLDKYVRGRAAQPILVVDDDSSTREITTWILEQQGWRVVEAGGFQQGLERLAGESPRLIVLNLTTPETDGFRFLEERDGTVAWRDIPVIVVAAQEFTPTQIEYLHARAASVLTRGPDTGKELLSAVSTVLGAEGEPSGHGRASDIER